MIITIWKYNVEISIKITDRSNPFNLSLRGRRKLAALIEGKARSYVPLDRKIARIKAMRDYKIETAIMYRHNFVLRDCKLWVELAFQDNGNGDIA